MQKVIHGIGYRVSEFPLRLRWHPRAVIGFATGVAISLVAMTVLVIAFQLAYPRNRALPLAHLESGMWVGFQSTEQVAATLQTSNTRKLTVTTNGKNTATSATELGIATDATATAQNLQKYSWGERLVPFSILAKSNQRYAIIKKYDQPKLEKFAQALASTPDKPSKDATLTVQGVKAAVTPSEDGYIFNKDEVEKRLKDSDTTLYDQIELTPTISKAKISTEAAQSAANIVQQRINAPINVTVEDKTVQLASPQIAAWFIITPVPEQGTIRTAFDQAKIKNDLKPLATTFYRAPTPTTVPIIDGKPGAEHPGIAGRTLLIDDLTAQIAQAQSTTQAAFTGKTTAVVPAKIYTRSYTRTSAGLQALIDYWLQSHRGQYGIDLRTTDGLIVAGSAANKKFTSASIYKLYVASLVYGRITAGSMSGSTVTSTGATIDACLYKMIYSSDNPCAVALGNMIGWNANDATLHAQGFENTSLSSGAFQTTANDSADWLASLLRGTLVTSDQRNSLLDVMTRQIYRSGIPAGSRGMVVADKVGFIDGYYHDTAIVYHPKGTYILTIFTNGAGVAAIADLAAQISQTMSQ